LKSAIPRVRCRATSKQRKRATPDADPESWRCRKQAIAGGLVCDIHGGKSPGAIQGARERLRDAADPAAAELVRLMEDPLVEAGVKLQAAKAILDRSGHGPTGTQVQVDGGKVRYDIAGVDMEAL